MNYKNTHTKPLSSILSIVTASIVSFTPSSNASVNIVMNYDVGFDTAADDSYKRYFEIAEFVWETVLVDRRYSDGTAASDIQMSANLSTSGDDLDIGNGASYARMTSFNTVLVDPEPKIYNYATSGRIVMQRSVHADVDLNNFSRIFAFTTIHEMGHALGFGGKVWDDLNLNTVSGQFSGSTALDFYLAEYGVPVANYTYVPLENSTGVGGTDEIHLDGDYGGGFNGEATTDYTNKEDYGLFLDGNHPNAAIAAIFDNTGGAGTLGVRPTGANNKVRSFNGDVLSGTLGIGGGIHLSDTTIAMFEDMGYETVLTVPEPSSSALIILSSGIILLRRKR